MIELRDPLEQVAEEFPPGYYMAVEQPLTVLTQQWLKARESGSNELDTSAEEIAEIREHIVSAGASDEFMCVHWPKLEKLLENPALAKLIKTPRKDDLLGDSSRFLPMMLCLFPFSAALEIAFLHGLTTDLSFAELEPDDPYYWTAVREKLFKYIRMRSAWSADVMAKIKPERSLFLSCGRMFAKRYVDPTIYGRAELVDLDPTIRLEDLFPDDNVRKNYTLHTGSDEELLRECFNGTFQFVEMMGRAIYMFTEDDCQQLHSFFRLVLSKMSAGGRLVFDVNCAHPDWNKLLLPIAFTRGKVSMTFLKDNDSIISYFFQHILYDLPIGKVRIEPIQLEGQDIGVVFSVRKLNK